MSDMAIPYRHKSLSLPRAILDASTNRPNLGRGATLEFIGANDTYGSELHEMSAERSIGTTVCDDANFPFGVKGMLPVMTSRRKKGGVKTTYAFPFAEGQPDESNELAHELVEATNYVNMLLGEARELSGYQFGEIGALYMGIGERGYGFTRVEIIPNEEEGVPAAAPIHLRLETTDKPGEPGSLSATIEYDPDGYVHHVLMTEFAESGEVVRAMADFNFRRRDIFVSRVISTPAGGGEPEELYRRYPKRTRDHNFASGNYQEDRWSHQYEDFR